MEHLREALEQAKEGDVDGFAVLVERFQDMAVGYSYSILGDFHLAEDAAQEAFLEAYPNLYKVYGPEVFPSWFKRIVFKHCDRILRRKTLDVTQLDEASLVAAPDGDPESAAEGRELEAEILAAVKSLPAAARSAITLFYVSDYSQREICEFLGIPATTLKSRLHRGRRQLQERMIGMVEENLRQNRPSNDKAFVNGVWSGLRDVYAGWTEASLIDGDRGRLFYRGYSVESLAEHSSFEEVCYLMFYGALPTRGQLEEFDVDLKSGRHVPDSTLSMLRGMTGMQPIDALRTVVSAMSGSEAESADNSHQGAIRKGIRLTASAATILAAHSRMSRGEDPVAPDETLGHAANFLFMLSGKMPDRDDCRALDKALILHAEHGANASSFAARTVASTGADLYSAITAAMAALKGPKHGGAAAEVVKMADEIGSAERAAGYVKAVLDRGGRVAGFGHPVYRTADPRADCLEKEARMTADRKGNPAWFSTLEAVKKGMQRHARDGIGPNVDLWSGAIYRLLGIPEEMFSAVFAAGRIPGWVVHAMEQEASAVLLRPRLRYNGPVDLAYAAIEERG